MKAQAHARSVRTRRSGGEVRSRLTEAGRQLFAEFGYAGASTKQIAARADVTEVLLFRHFGSKAGIFDAAVLDPLQRFIDSYRERWTAPAAQLTDPYELTREYIDLLYGFFEDHRELLVALLGAKAHYPTAARKLDQIFTTLQDIVQEATAERTFPIRDPDITVRLTFGLVLSASINSDVLFPNGSSLSRDQLVDELTRYMMQGITQGPGPGNGLDDGKSGQFEKGRR